MNAGDILIHARTLKSKGIYEVASIELGATEEEGLVLLRVLNKSCEREISIPHLMLDSLIELGEVEVIWSASRILKENDLKQIVRVNRQKAATDPSYPDDKDVGEAQAWLEADEAVRRAVNENNIEHLYEFIFPVEADKDPNSPYSKPVQAISSLVHAWANKILRRGVLSEYYKIKFDLLGGEPDED